jgi:hypothetical protein
MSISLDGFVSDLEGRNTWMFGADQIRTCPPLWRANP